MADNAELIGAFYDNFVSELQVKHIISAQKRALLHTTQGSQGERLIYAVEDVAREHGGPALATLATAVTIVGSGSIGPEVESAVAYDKAATPIESTVPACTTLHYLGNRLVVLSGHSSAAAQQQIRTENAGRNPLMYRDEFITDKSLVSTQSDEHVTLLPGDSISSEAEEAASHHGLSINAEVVAIEQANNVTSEDQAEHLPVGFILDIPANMSRMQIHSNAHHPEYTSSQLAGRLNVAPAIKVEPRARADQVRNVTGVTAHDNQATKKNRDTVHTETTSHSTHHLAHAAKHHTANTMKAYEASVGSPKITLRQILAAVSVAESGRPANPNVTNQFGFHGAWQFGQQFWHGWALQYLHDESAPWTTENQVKVAVRLMTDNLASMGSADADVATWLKGSAVGDAIARHDKSAYDIAMAQRDGNGTSVREYMSRIEGIIKTINVNNQLPFLSNVISNNPQFDWSLLDREYPLYSKLRLAELHPGLSAVLAKHHKRATHNSHKTHNPSHMLSGFTPHSANRKPNAARFSNKQLKGISGYSNRTIVWPFSSKNSSQTRRIDQGEDLQTFGGARVRAIASGMIYKLNKNPGGFGNNYPTEKLDRSIGGPTKWLYYGHVHILRKIVGKHVNAGQVIARTNRTDPENGSSAPAGWLEIGFAQPLTDAPAQTASSVYEAATPAGYTMRAILRQAQAVRSATHKPYVSSHTSLPRNKFTFKIRF